MAGPFRRCWGLAVIIFISAAAALSASAPAAAQRADGPMSFLENGKLRVGVSLFDGGKITYLAAVQGPFPHDLLQDVQQSYSGGPPDQFWGANANGATVIANRNDGHTIYTKVIAQQASPSYKQCDCILETWVTLKGNAVHVRNRLTNFRTDGATWTAHFQELPALYTTGDAYRLYTYGGDAPYTSRPVEEITSHRGEFFTPGQSFRAPEHWAALVNDERYGVGLFDPQLVRFNGVPGNDYAVDYGWVNGYLTSSAQEILDANISYTYDYTLVVGTLEDIRGYAVAHRPDRQPVYRFRSDRRHWWELNATDAGAPIRGAIRFLPDQDDPQLYGPETDFPAAGVRALYIRGAWHTRQGQAQLFWDTDGYTEERSSTFGVLNDGRFHTYRIPLAVRAWAGTIHGLRLDPVYTAELGGWIDIACISWKPCPRDRRSERLLERSRPVAFHDSFDTLNEGFWSQKPLSPGTFADVRTGGLILTATADAQPDAGATTIAAGLVSRCALVGNYDLRVDYRLLEWPPENGVHLNFGTSSDAIGRLNTHGDAYFASFPPSAGGAATTDTSGTLRFVRSGRAVAGYYRHGDAWVEILRSESQRGGELLKLSISSADSDFSHREVQVAFDELRVARGLLSCP
jgi:hypothetical protein